MALHAQNQKAKTDESGGVAVTMPDHPLLRNWKRIVLVIAGIAIIAAGGWFAWTHHRTAVNDAAANAKEQKNLQKDLALDLGHGDFQAVAYDTTQLINGKLSNKYTFSDKQLAVYYMDAGSAAYNLKNYKDALADYKAAPAYDNALKQAALEGEVTAGYATGERQQLIPLLQQLVALSKNAHNPESYSSVQYQADITAIQQNKEAEL